MSFLSKLFGGKSKSAALHSIASIDAFRDQVIAKAKSLGSTFDFQLDPNDPGRFSMLSKNGYAGSSDLNNAFKQFEVYPNADMDENIEKLARIILQNEIDKDEVDTKDIVLVLRPTEYIEAIKAQTDEMIASPMLGELHEFYMVDTPEAMRGLQKSDVMDVDMGDIRKIALENVKDSISDIVSDTSIEGVTLYYVDNNTLLSPSLILLDEFWELVDENLKARCLIALPRKDQLFLFDENHPQARLLAEQMVKVTFAEGFNLLSTQIMHRENGQIKLLE